MFWFSVQLSLVRMLTYGGVKLQKDISRGKMKVILAICIFSAALRFLIRAVVLTFGIVKFYSLFGHAIYTVLCIKFSGSSSSVSHQKVFCLDLPQPENIVCTRVSTFLSVLSVNPHNCCMYHLCFGSTRFSNFVCESLVSQFIIYSKYGLASFSDLHCS